MLRLRCFPGAAFAVHRRAFSVSHEEVAKFSRIGSNWWNSDSAAGAGPLHFMNPTRVSFIRTQMASILGKEGAPALDQLAGLRILDVGCGGGLLAESLARLGAQVTAIDPSEQNIAVAKEHASKDPATASIRYLRTSVEEMAKREEKFDVVTALEVIEHTNDPRGFLLSCSRCLKQQGSLFISTINPTRKAYLLTIALAERCLKMLPEGTHDWNLYLSPSDLSGMLTESLDMDVLTVKGLVPDVDLQALLLQPSISTAIKKWKLSDDDLDVNYILHSVRRAAKVE